MVLAPQIKILSALSHAPNQVGETSLMVAARNNDIPTLNLLLDVSGIKLNYKKLVSLEILCTVVRGFSEFVRTGWLDCADARRTLWAN